MVITALTTHMNFAQAVKIANGASPLINLLMVTMLLADASLKTTIGVKLA